MGEKLKQDTRSTLAMQMARAAAVLIFGLCTRGLYATAGCPDGWSRHSNRCYKVFGKPMSKQSDAAAECQKVGSELVKIETEGENQFLENLFNKARSDGVLADGLDIWLDARRPTTKSQFVWSSGAPVSLTAWASGQPKPKDGGHTALCLQYFRNNNQHWAMHVAACHDSFKDNAYACELAGCPDGWSRHSNRCYKVFGKPMAKQSDAAAECQKVGSELVKIETEGENQFLVNLFLKARSDGVLAHGIDIWLDARRSTTKSQFVWSSGVPVSLTAWESGQPKAKDGGKTALCLQYLQKKNYQWAMHVAACHDKFKDNAYACEMAVAVPAPDCGCGTITSAGNGCQCGTARCVTGQRCVQGKCKAGTCKHLKRIPMASTMMAECKKECSNTYCIGGCQSYNFQYGHSDEKKNGCFLSTCPYKGQ